MFFKGKEYLEGPDFDPVQFYKDLEKRMLDEVNKLTDGEDYDRIIEILDVEDNETFDIKLHSGSLDEYVTKLDDGKFEVKIPVPERFENKAYCRIGGVRVCVWHVRVHGAERVCRCECRRWEWGHLIRYAGREWEYHICHARRDTSPPRGR